LLHNLLGVKKGQKNYEIQFSQRTPTGFTLSNHG
jgi:hypothetical protein